MKFACEKCHTKYSIADEKVRRKVLKIRCKSCGNVIEVREPVAAAPPGEFDESSTRIDPGVGVMAAAAAFTESRAPERARRPPTPVGSFSKAPGAAVARAPLPADWHLALDGKQEGPFTRAELVRHLARLPPRADVHIWREDLGGWKEPSAVPDIDREVKAARGRPALPPPAPAARRPPLPPPGGGAAIKPAPGPNGAKNGSPAARAVEELLGPAASAAASTPPPVHPDATPPPVFPSHGKPGLAPFPIEDMTGPLAARAREAHVVLPTPVSHHDGVATPVVAATESGVYLKKSRLANFRYLILVGIVVVVLIGIFGAYLSAKTSPTAQPSDGKGAAAKHVSAAELAQRLDDGPTIGAAPPARTVAVIGPQPERHTPSPRPSRGPGRPVAGAPAARMTPAQEAAARRFADSGRIGTAVGAPAGPRTPASPEAIKAVFKANQGAIKTCYDRALARDRTLTHGRIDVTVLVGTSGRAKSVQTRTTSEFRMMETCVKDVITHWAFPSSGEDYEAAFPYIFQGG